MKTILAIVIGFFIFNALMFVIGLYLSFKNPTAPTYEEYKPVTRGEKKDHTGQVLDVTVKTMFFPLYAIHLVAKTHYQRKRRHHDYWIFPF